MSHQPTHPFITPADYVDALASLSVTEAPTVPRKITPCAMLSTGFGTLSALRVTENGNTSYQIAATCRFDVAKNESNLRNPNKDTPLTPFDRMNVRGGVYVMDVVSGEDPEAVCLLNDDYTSFEAMWADYEIMVAHYVDINEVWLKAREA